MSHLKDFVRSLSLALLPVAGAVLLVTGCQTPSAGGPAGTPEDLAEFYSPPTTNSIPLHENDLIDITFPGATNLSRINLQIPADGMVVLDFGGRFKASGKLPEELQAEILKAYENQLLVKEVNVSLKACAAYVTVTGAVLRPDKVAWRPGMTAFDAVMSAGGPIHSRARPSKCTLVRDKAGKKIRLEFDLMKAIKTGDSEPIYLRPYDVIYVPERVINL